MKTSTKIDDVFIAKKNQVLNFKNRNKILLHTKNKESFKKLDIPPDITLSFTDQINMP